MVEEGGEERCPWKGVGDTPGTAERSGCHWARRLLAAEEGAVVLLELFFVVVPWDRNLEVVVVVVAGGFLVNVRACFRTVPGRLTSVVSTSLMCFRPERSLTSTSSSDGYGVLPFGSFISVLSNEVSNAIFGASFSSDSP